MHGDAIGSRYRRLARDAGIASPRTGSLMVVHRASGDLRLNVHYHSLALDGVFDGHGRFHRAPAPTPEDVEAILARIIAQAERLLEGRERGLDEDEEAIAQAYAVPQARGAGAGRAGRLRRT